MCIFEDARNWVRRFWQHCTLPEKKFLSYGHSKKVPRAWLSPIFKFRFLKIVVEKCVYLKARETGWGVFGNIIHFLKKNSCRMDTPNKSRGRGTPGGTRQSCCMVLICCLCHFFELPENAWDFFLFLVLNKFHFHCIGWHFFVIDIMTWNNEKIKFITAKVSKVTKNTENSWTTLDNNKQFLWDIYEISLKSCQICRKSFMFWCLKVCKNSLLWSKGWKLFL